MNTEQHNTDIEIRITNGLRLSCILFALVTAILIRAFFDIDSSNHWFTFVLLFGIGFGLSAVLQRLRPKRSEAGVAWSRLYDFILSQMDMTIAFRRKKKKKQKK